MTCSTRDHRTLRSRVGHRALDALTLVAFLLVLVAAVFGAVTMYLGPVRVSLRGEPCPLSSPLPPLPSAMPRILGAPLPRRLAAADAIALAANLPLSAAARAVASRVAVLAVGYLAVLTIGVVQPATGLELSGDPLFNLPARFDAGWYGGIALDGYSFEGTIRQAAEPGVLSCDAAADADRWRRRRRRRSPPRRGPCGWRARCGLAS